MSASRQWSGPTRAIFWILSAIVSLVFPAYGSAQHAGRTVLIDEPVANDLYVAGREVQIVSPVNGDLILAGGTVRVSGDISGDIIAAGRDVTVNARVADDVRLAGQRVAVAGKVGGRAVAAGGDLRIERSGQVADFAWLAGRHIEIVGRVGGDLRAAGGVVVLSGHIDGDAEISGEKIRIDDGASIGGDLTWRSSAAPDISPSAMIGGDIIEGAPMHWQHSRTGSLARRVLAYLSAIVAAALVFGIFRPLCEQILTTVQARPWAAMLTGFAALVLTPVVVVLLFVTRIGSILAVLLTLIYGLTLMVGALTGVVAVAKLGLSPLADDQRDKFRNQIAAITVVVIVIGALFAIRPIGILVSTVVMLFGAGALTLDAHRRIRTLHN